jgi:hypothetical protein
MDNIDDFNLDNDLSLSIDDDFQKSLDESFQEWNNMELEYTKFKINQKTTEIYQKMYGILYLLTFVYLYKKTYGLEINNSGDKLNILSTQIKQEQFQELVVRHNILFNYFFIMIFIGFNILKNK